MNRLARFFLTAAVLVAGSCQTPAFSLLGPYATYQTAVLGYNRAGDIGAPKPTGQGYRWNVPQLTYAFDDAFLSYFGQPGVDAINKAVKILNDLPPVSQMSSNLAEYPLNTLSENFSATALGLVDIKSTALSFLLEEMGLAEPERWAFCLNGRATVTFGAITITNYSVIMRNYDPITLRPSRYVNGNLYTYSVMEPLLPGNYADAIEFPFTTTSVSGFAGFGNTGFYFAGLTRDDVGGLRYLYNSKNQVIEGLQTTATVFASGIANGGGYGYVWGTNVFRTGGGTGGTLLTNNFVTVGRRPGMEKVTFTQLDLNSFIPYTNYYTDVVITNGGAYYQTIARPVLRPDIMFSGDYMLPLAPGLNPPGALRTIPYGTPTVAGTEGPGVNNAPITITFNLEVPALLNSDSLPDEIDATPTYIWGSYDGTPNPPVVFPVTPW